MRLAAGGAAVFAAGLAVGHWHRQLSELAAFVGWPAVGLMAVLIGCAAVNALRRPAASWLDEEAGRPAGLISDSDWATFAAGHGYPLTEE